MNRCQLLALVAFAALSLGRSPAAELIDARKIWDASPHNAFTDLARWNGTWFCVFREGAGHVSPDGAVRILSSPNGIEWKSAGRLTHPEADLRDPKITATPDGRLMIAAAGAFKRPELKHQTFAWFSSDARDWTTPAPIGEPNVWLWRILWSDATAFGAGYSTVSEKFVRLYSSSNGTNFNPVVPFLFDQGYPNEAGLVLLPDETMLCLLRRDGDPSTAQFGNAAPPYRNWEWQDLGVRIGGPTLIRLPNGRLIAGVRLYTPSVRTAIVELDPKTAKLTELLSLPSGGDTSYPGLVWHDGLLWISYYSSHEGKTSIYLAKAKL